MYPKRFPLPGLGLALLLAIPGPISTSRAAEDRRDWPQWGGPDRDGVYREKGIVEELPESPSYRWRREIGAGYAGPAVAGGKVYVTDRLLDAGERNPDNPFRRSPVGGRERVLCLDSRSGDLIWKHEYPCRYTISYGTGPRATPTVDGDRVYTLGAMGDLHCLDVDSGSVEWSRDYVEDYGTEINMWGMTAAPLVDGDRLIVLAGGSEGRGVLALDKQSGEERWRALELSDPGYSPPVIIEAGGTRQLIVWTPRELVSLSPKSGKVHWRQPFELESNLSIMTPVFDPGTHQLFVSAFYNGPVMMQLERDEPAASLLWKGKSDSETRTDILHSLMCTPVRADGYLYGVGSYGQLRCIEAATGKRIWETFEATGHDRWWNAFIVPHGDRYIIANEQGELIFCDLTPGGYEEQSRLRVIEPTNKVRRRKVVWVHPAFAERAVFWRNDGEIVCVDLAAE